MTVLEQKIEQANARVLEIILKGRPVWTDMVPAGEIIPGMRENLILHAGPNCEPENIVGPMRIGICGRAVHEGLAKEMDEAWKMVEKGEICIASAQDYGCACGAAICTSYHTPVHVVKDTVNGTMGFCAPHPGAARDRLRWGFYDEQVEKDMCWLRDIYAPAINAALRMLGGVDVKEGLSKTAGMGDENHVRQPGSSMAQALQLIDTLVDLDVPGRDEVIHFLTINDRFYLHVVMAAVESVMVSAKQVPYSTVLAGLGGNGYELGIQMSGTGNRWYTVPAPLILGRFLDAKTTQDDLPGFLGDSCVTEVYGLGGFSAVAGPAFVRLTHPTDSFAEARRRTESARAVSLGEHNFAPIPWDEYRGFPAGIDVRKVVALNQAPTSHGGSTLKKGGQGGAGAVILPMEMFRKALIAFAQQVRGEMNT